MPFLNDIVSVADGYQGENLLGADVGYPWHRGLPTERAEPADGEGELFLHRWRCESNTTVSQGSDEVWVLGALEVGLHRSPLKVRWTLGSLTRRPSGLQKMSSKVSKCVK